MWIALSYFDDWPSCEPEQINNLNRSIEKFADLISLMTLYYPVCHLLAYISISKSCANWLFQLEPHLSWHHNQRHTKFHLNRNKFTREVPYTWPPPMCGFSEIWQTNSQKSFHRECCFPAFGCPQVWHCSVDHHSVHFCKFWSSQSFSSMGFVPTMTESCRRMSPVINSNTWRSPIFYLTPW